jgi:uncharacterized protein YbjQ (UPF0145 family)
VTAIVEMQKAQDKQKADAIAARITELATTGEKAVKVESVRGVVIELVTVRQPKNLEEVDQVYGEVIETQNVKRLLQSQVREIMGPSLGTGNKGQANGNSSQWWEDEPAAKEA